MRTDLPAHLSTCQSVPVTCAFTGCSEKVCMGGREAEGRDEGGRKMRDRKRERKDTNVE